MEVSFATHFITELSKLGANITTHTYNSPLQVSEEIQNDITILENIDLNNLDDAVRIDKFHRFSNP